MKPKADKCHLLVFVAKYKHGWTKIGNEKIWGSKEVKLVGVTVDDKFKYGSHIANICFEANQKLSILSRSSMYLRAAFYSFAVRLIFILSEGLFACL